MKQNYVLSMFILVLVFSFVLSCTDHLPPNPLPNQQRIKSITQILPQADGATFISNFTYNAQNQVEFIRSSPVPASIPGKRATTHYSYDINKNISEVHRTFNDGPAEERYVYTIGSLGQITQLNYNGGGSEVYNMIFNYNGQQLQNSSRRFTTSGISYRQDIVYHFGGQNLSSADYTTTLIRDIPSVGTSTLTFAYDDKINPFFGMPVIPAPNEAPKPSMGNFNYYTFSGGLDNLLYLNHNNVLSAKSSTLAEINYQYTYNSDGLPLTRNTIRKTTPQVQPLIEETLVFEYETY